MERNLSDVIDSTAMERNIYITSIKKTNNPRFTGFCLAFRFLHRTRCSDSHHSSSGIHILRSNREFYHPFHRFASVHEAESVVATILSDQEFVPFSIGGERGQGLHWQELNHNITDNPSEEPLEQGIPLHGFHDVVAKISEAATRVVGEAMVLGHNVVEMVVTIHKRTVITHEEFTRFLPHYVHYHDPDLDRAMGGQSFGEAYAAAVPVLAAKPAVEALEKFRYERSTSSVDGEDDQSELLMCAICLEEVMIGSILTRMPCSHKFHYICIWKWLEKRRSCPICRSKLPRQLC